MHSFAPNLKFNEVHNSLIFGHANEPPVVPGENALFTGHIFSSKVGLAGPSSVNPSNLNIHLVSAHLPVQRKGATERDTAEHTGMIYCTQCEKQGM